VLAAADFTVLVSNYTRYFRLVEYLSRNTREAIGISLGIRNVRDLFDDRRYEDLDGGVLEATGRLFKSQVRLFVYPELDADTGDLVTADSVELEGHVDVVYRYQVDEEDIQSISGFDPDVLDIHSHDVLARIRSGDESWVDLVPPVVAETIRGGKLFGYRE